MILLFMFSFSLGVIMMFTGFLRSAVYHSGINGRTRQAKRKLRKHHFITLLMFAIAVYAAFNLV